MFNEHGYDLNKLTYLAADSGDPSRFYEDVYVLYQLGEVSDDAWSYFCLACVDQIMEGDED